MFSTQSTTKGRAVLATATALAAVTTVLGATTAPASATSPCRTTQAPGGGIGIVGAYVQVGPVAAMSSCAAVRFSRQSSSQVTVAGAVNDTASDGYPAVVIVRAKVNGVWSSWRTAATQFAQDQWRTFSFPIAAVGTISDVQARACRYGYGTTSACGVPVQRTP